MIFSYDYFFFQRFLPRAIFFVTFFCQERMWWEYFFCLLYGALTRSSLPLLLLHARGYIHRSMWTATMPAPTRKPSATKIMVDGELPPTSPLEPVLVFCVHVAGRGASDKRMSQPLLVIPFCRARARLHVLSSVRGLARAHWSPGNKPNPSLRIVDVLSSLASLP